MELNNEKLKSNLIYFMLDLVKKQENQIETLKKTMNLS